MSSRTGIKTSLALLIAILLTVAAPALAFYSGGDGTEAAPWQIANKTDLLNIAQNETLYGNHYNANFILTDNIDMAGTTYTTAIIAPGTSSTFTGVFNGNDFKITNLTIDDGGAGNNCLGLFGKIDNGQIKNLGLEDVSVSGTGNYAGGLVGIGGNVSNCYSTGSVNGFQYVGGLVGFGSNLSNCYSTGLVNGDGSVGGLVGCNSHNLVSNCYSTGDVNGRAFVGGLVGFNLEGTISHSYSTGSVTGTEYYIGGLVGGLMPGMNSFEEGGHVDNSYSTGSVSGDMMVGGLIGANAAGNISNCYSIGDVSGNTAVGGLVGVSTQAMGTLNCSNVENCFWDTDTQTHGVTESFGSNSCTVTNVAGLTTVEMQTQSTFTDPPASWDFVDEETNGTENIWRMCIDGIAYPRLSWEFYAGDFTCPDGVELRDFAVFALAWLTVDGDLNYNPHCDIATPADNEINGPDLHVFINNWLSGREITGDFADPYGVNIKDFAVFALAWQIEEGQPGWNPDCNLATPADNIINELDLRIFLKHWLLGTTP